MAEASRGGQRLSRARSSRALAHGERMGIAEWCRGREPTGFTDFFTEKSSDLLVDGTARENEVSVRRTTLPTSCPCT